MSERPMSYLEFRNHAVMKLRVIWRVLRGKGVCYRLTFVDGIKLKDVTEDILITECTFIDGGVKGLPGRISYG